MARERPAMAKLPFVKEYTDTCGIRRRYFRRKGFKGGPLPGPIGSPEFMEAYQAYMAAQPAPLARAKNGPGTFAALVESYYRSGDYKNLKDSSRQLYRYALEPLKEKHGHRMAHDMRRDKLVKIIEEIGERAPGMANLTRAVLQKMMKVAKSRGDISVNPLADTLTAYKIGTHHTWTDEELLQFEARWPLGTRQRLAYALLFYTGQRGGDVVRMRRKDIKDGVIDVVQEKTGTEVSIGIHPDLAKAIAAGPAKGLTLIGDEHGRPIKRAALSHLMRRAIKDAGLPARCVSHGLRKAVMRTMAENDASGKQMAAVSGHKTSKEVDRYTAAADRVKLARKGIASIPIRK